MEDATGVPSHSLAGPEIPARPNRGKNCMAAYNFSGMYVGAGLLKVDENHIGARQLYILCAGGFNRGECNV
jgi:hypothetical protein